MPDVTVKIGDREFEVACQEGEEHYLRSAAALLDTEAQSLVSQIRHLTESRMLLMAGLMLADKTAGIDDTLKLAERKIAELEARLAEAEVRRAEAETRAAGAATGPAIEALSAIAGRAEALAQAVEDKAAGDRAAG
ncbi:MAG: cell division protein ZapA [Maritimibacter sp.]|nr:cell division protein ZapA [Maritimibacter sp.]